MGSRRGRANAVVRWLKRQPPKVKAFLCVVAGMSALAFLRFIVHEHDNLFVAAEACHALGIAVLIYKLTKDKTCAGGAMCLVLDTRGRLLTALGYGMWPSMVLLSEIVQTFILADFCYYYVKSLVDGEAVLRLPSGVV